VAAFASDQDRAAAAATTLGLDKPERIRAKSRDLEGAEQRALFKWAKYAQNRFPELQYLFHVPNGGARNAITGARLKAQGVKAGVPDIYLDVARGCYHGLRIELKAGKGKASEDQHNWILNLQAQGYYAQVCVGWEEARELIVKYLTS
jgi:hypothetical protein